MSLSRRSFLRRAAGVSVGAVATVVAAPLLGRETGHVVDAPDPHRFVGSHHSGDSDDFSTFDTFDHLVSSAWDGEEGLTMQPLGGRRFRVWRSPQGAIDAATSGQTVFVAPGTYNFPVYMRSDVQLDIVGSRFEA